MITIFILLIVFVLWALVLYSENKSGHTYKSLFMSIVLLVVGLYCMVVSMPDKVLQGKCCHPNCCVKEVQSYDDKNFQKNISPRGLSKT